MDTTASKLSVVKDFACMLSEIDAFKKLGPDVNMIIADYVDQMRFAEKRYYLTKQAIRKRLPTLTMEHSLLLSSFPHHDYYPSCCAFGLDVNKKIKTPSQDVYTEFEVANFMMDKFDMPPFTVSSCNKCFYIKTDGVLENDYIFTLVIYEKPSAAFIHVYKIKKNVSRKHGLLTSREIIARACDLVFSQNVNTSEKNIGPHYAYEP
jgi:hypothetical protein